MDTATHIAEQYLAVWNERDLAARRAKVARMFTLDAQYVDSLLWIQREALSDGPGSEATALLDELAALLGIRLAAHVPNLDRRTLPFMPIQVRKDGVELSMFTTITTMGTPHDVTVHELRLEAFFPVDEATARWFRDRAAEGACGVNAFAN